MAGREDEAMKMCPRDIWERFMAGAGAGAPRRCLTNITNSDGECIVCSAINGQSCLFTGCQP